MSTTSQQRYRRRCRAKRARDMALQMRFGARLARGVAAKALLRRRLALQGWRTRKTRAGALALVNCAATNRDQTEATLTEVELRILRLRRW